jgi:hypothetical protein
MFLLYRNPTLVPTLTDLGDRLLQKIYCHSLWRIEGKRLVDKLFRPLFIIGQAGLNPQLAQLPHGLTRKMGHRGRRRLRSA